MMQLINYFMKNTRFFDTLFILICGVVFSVITWYGYSKLLGQFSIIVALAAYFVGKYVGQIESDKKHNKDKPL